MTTFRSKLAVLAFLAIFAAPAAFAADPAPAEPTKAQLELAKKYVAAVPVDEDVKTAVEQLSARISPDQRVLFRSLAEKNIDYARLNNAAELAAAKTFSEAELKAMVAFFNSPEGQSARKKMLKYQSLVQPTITEVLQNFVLKVQENNITPLPDAASAAALGAQTATPATPGAPAAPTGK